MATAVNLAKACDEERARKPYSGNLYLRFDEGSGVTPAPTLPEAAAIPIRWVAQRDKMVPLHQVREIGRFLRHLGATRNTVKRASQLAAVAAEMFGQGSTNPWVQFLTRLLDTWQQESADAALPIYEAMEFLCEACAESRREFSYGDGVTLSTVHAAKGTEYDHVLLVGNWPVRQERAKLEESRRAFYVGMTRARKTLSVFDRQDIKPSCRARSPVLPCSFVNAPKNR